jgi:hypothetical protein
LRNNIAIENLNLLCDLELIFGLHTILPLLKCMHTLIKFAQFHNVFVCENLPTITFYQLYNDPYNKFNDPLFDELKVLETFTNKNLLMSWCVDLNGEEANCLVIEYFLS